MRTTNLLLTLHAHLEQDQAPPPKGGGWEGVEQPTFTTHPDLNPETHLILKQIVK
ncbi:hypothetical protein LZF95_25905 [Algoriphagus sp. AGSA1]|uniref:hypothetical protein n=1 Tax=Algoriphagus sp. AGSA1 TaxID=2907213 RepID=UPI001F2CD3EF|nr:hypothetical protein [Algoriphagus sp. AGSA1]MCE7058144.1 hypothetical protein [Algoriphagus sp. AGSA1]